MKKNILIVDNEKTFLDSLRIIVKKFDDEFEVYTAYSAKEAMELMSSSDIDLLITDIYMPDRDGLELIKEVRRKNSSPKIIAISGDTRYLKVAKSFGASYSLEKPFELDELKSIIDKVFS